MKISVVTGYFNRGPVLERTLRSILEQTRSDLELLVFDDASTDDTAERLKALSESLGDDRFRYVIHESNRGFVTGLRDAISLTSGDYIAIQGSGDVSLPRRLELQAAVLDASPEVGVVGSWYENYEESTGVARLRTPDTTGLTFEKLLKGNVFSHGEVMFRRSLYEEVGGYRVAFRNSQDYDLWLRMIQKSKFSVVPELLYRRYIQFDGVSYEPSKLAIQGRYSLIAQRAALLPDDDAAALVASLQESGPKALVPANDKALQKRYMKGAIRFVLWGANQAGERMARDFITNPVVRASCIGFARVWPTPFAAPVRYMAQRILHLDPSTSGQRG